MNQYKTDYTTLLDQYLSKGASGFNDLSLSHKKELSLSYIKTLSYLENQSLVEDIYENLSDKLPEMMVNILSNENKRIDPAYEMADEFTRELIMIVGRSIDEDMEDSFDKNIDEKCRTIRELDSMERARDMSLAIKLGF